MRLSTRVRGMFLLLAEVVLFSSAGHCYASSFDADPATQFDVQITRLLMGSVLLTVGLLLLFHQNPCHKPVVLLPLVSVFGVYATTWKLQEAPVGIDLTIFYNRLLFLLISGVLVTLSFLAYIAYRTNIKRYVRPTRVMIVGFVVVVVCISLHTRAKEEWPYGLLGGRIEADRAACRIPTDHFPFWAILPPRLTNCFVGPARCSGSQFSSISSNNTLTMKCDKNEYAWVRMNPDFIAHKKEADKSSLHRLQLQGGEERMVPYHGPMALGDSEYLIAHCGKKEDFHVRNLRNLRKTDSQDVEGDRMNVVVLMIDSLSRAHFHRRLPATARALEDLSDRSHSVFQFFRYHIVGHSTSANTNPLFLGLWHREIHKIRTSSPAREDLFYWSYWKRHGGHATMWALEECSDYFAEHYGLGDRGGGDLNLDHSLVAPFCHPLYDGRTRTNFAGPYSLSHRCIGGRFVHEYTLDYVKQFLDNYADVGAVATALLMEGHEGSMEVVATLDHDLAHFLETTAARHANTAFVLVSDHGCHMGPYFMYARSGWLEHKLPALFFLFPKSFLRAHPSAHKALKANEQQLVTPFDVYLTLLHMATPDKHPVDPLAGVIPGRTSPWRGGMMRSLMAGPIPPNRTCTDAGVPSHVCACNLHHWPKQYQ